VKLRSSILIIAAVIIIDQVLKIWIKTTYPLGPVTNILGLPWAKLYFIENEGMAWGWKLGGEWGKMLLTLFRLAAVIFGSWYLGRIVKQNYSRGFVICASLIYAGALGNLIDSLFYGLIFEESTYSHIAAIFPPHGYGSFLHGKVVDMLYFPMVHSTFPSWIPFIGGNEFEFFSPIFNVADASISVGVIALLLFQKRLLKKTHTEEPRTVTTSSEISDQAQVM
jgi:signal peptidase II